MEAEGGDDESGDGAEVTEDMLSPSTSSAGSGSVEVTSVQDRAAGIYCA